MSKKLFTELEINKLSLNQFVVRVSSKSIKYSDEFKHLFIKEYLEGNSPTSISKGRL